MKIHEVEQGSSEWFAIRAGKPTASEFSKLVTSKGEPSKSMPEYAIQLAADHIAGEPVDRWQGNEWSERGHEMEDRARAWYELEHPTRIVTQVGFITDDAETYGASPDSLVSAPGWGLISDSKAEKGILEIKCLKAPRHIKALMYFQKNERMPTDYVQQTQGQMMIAECGWCDLVFWHPDLPALVIHNHPIEKVVANLKMQIKNCITERDRVVTMLRNFE